MTEEALDVADGHDATGRVVLGVPFASRLPRLGLNRASPSLPIGIGVVVATAGSRNVLWYAPRHLGGFRSITALVPRHLDAAGRPGRSA